MKNERFLVIFMIILGVIAFVVGIINVVKQNTYLPAQAEVIDIRTETSGTDTRHTDFIYKVRYEINGQQYESEISLGMNAANRGDIIDILYDADNPISITEPGWGAAIYLLIIGPVVILISIFIFMKNMRPERK